MVYRRPRPEPARTYRRPWAAGERVESARTRPGPRVARSWCSGSGSGPGACSMVPLDPRRSKPLSPTRRRQWCCCGCRARRARRSAWLLDVGALDEAGEDLHQPPLKRRSASGMLSHEAIDGARGVKLGVGRYSAQFVPVLEKTSASRRVPAGVAELAFALISPGLRRCDAGRVRRWEVPSRGRTARRASKRRGAAFTQVDSAVGGMSSLRW